MQNNSEKEESDLQKHSDPADAADSADPVDAGLDIANDIINLDTEHVDPLFQESSDSKPLRKTDIYNARILTQRQLTMLHNILRKATPYIPVGSYESNPAIDTSMIYLYSTSSNEFVYGLRSKYILTKDCVKDLHTEAFKIVNGFRSKILHGAYRAFESTHVAEQISANNGSRMLFQETASLLVRIANGQYDYKPINQSDIIRNNIIADEYSLGLALKTLHASCSSYSKRCSIPYNGPEVKSIHKIVLIPRDLQAKLLRPRKYFEEIRTILKYNELTGFYEYIVQGLAIPIICKHEYMTYDGQSMAEISIECYRDGKCKYCGQELTAYHERMHESVSPKIYEIILKFLNSISHNIDTSALLYSLFNNIFDSAKDSLGNINNKDYVQTLFAFVCLYLYNIFINSTDNESATTIQVKAENKITYNSRIAIFLDTAKKYWSSIGWSMKSINNIIHQTEVLRNVDTPIKIIKNYIVKNLNDYLEQFPLSVLFDKIVYPESIANLTASTDMQKLWLAGHEKMLEFNSMIDRLYLSLWNHSMLELIVGQISSRAIRTTGLNIKFISQKPKSSQFFNSVCKYYCPVHFIHKFASGACKYCGLKNDLSNKNIVYDKYQTIINDAYLQNPNTIPKDRFSIQPLYNQSMLDKYKPNDLFEKYLVIEKNLEKQALEQKLSKTECLDQLSNMLNNVLHISIAGNSIELIRKSLCFIIDTKIISSKSILNELYNILFPFPNINYII